MHLLVDPSMKNLVKDLATLDFAGQKNWAPRQRRLGPVSHWMLERSDTTIN